MNWYLLHKESQQGLMFYPYRSGTESARDKAQPVGQSRNGESIYQCFGCSKNITESEVSDWLNVTEEGGDVRGSNYPPNPRNEYASPYNMSPEQISKSITYLAQLISPYIQKYKQQKEAWHAANNKDTNDYNSPFSGFDQTYEVNMPDVWQYLSSDPVMSQIIEISKIFSNGGLSFNAECVLRIRGPEINGYALKGLEPFTNNPQQFTSDVINIMASNKTFKVAVLQPFCEQCDEELPSCKICDKIIEPGRNAYPMHNVPAENDPDLVCERCMDSGKAAQCYNCGIVDYYDSDNMVQTNDGTYCTDCNRNSSSEAEEWANEALLNLNLPIGKNLPINPKAIQNTLVFIGFLKKSIDPYSPITPEVWSKIEYLTQKHRLSPESISQIQWMKRKSDQKTTLNSLEDQILGAKDGQDYLKEQYPQFKDLRDMPVDITVTSSFQTNASSGIPSFTLTIAPTDEFVEWAEHTHPGSAETWKRMNRSPHHAGSLAYARVAWDKNNLVVNNLQRDADSDAIYYNDGRVMNDKVLESAKFWDKQTRNWDLFLLHLVKAMAKSNNMNAYVTSFDSQKSKWSNLPIHKAKKSYEETPQMMGAEPRNAPIGLSENGENEAWKIARNKLKRYW